MVLMTGKLLGVSEGIAAMNLRIAAGVFFCVILLIATFIVNVIAFDFAKDNETNAGFLRDRDTHRPVATAPKYEYFRDVMTLDTPEDFFSASATMMIDSERAVQYTFDSHEMLPCPEEGSKYCEGKVVYLATAGNIVFYAYDGLTGMEFDYVDDAAFLAKVERKTFRLGEDQRHLLCQNQVQRSTDGDSCLSMLSYEMGVCRGGHCVA